MRYMVECDMRDKLTVSASQAGVFASPLLVEFEFDSEMDDGLMEDLDEGELDTDAVWRAAAERTGRLQARLARNEDVEWCVDLFAWPRLAVLTRDQMHCKSLATNATANIRPTVNRLDDIEEQRECVMPVFLTLNQVHEFDNVRRSEVLEIGELYFATPSRLRPFGGGSLTACVALVDDTLSITLSYNETVFSTTFVRQLCTFVLETVERLVTQ